jgi:nitroreductase
MSFMETWDAIRARRNVRTFTRQPIASHDLNQILEAGRRAPSASNWQPWDFVVVTDREQLQRLAGVWRAAGHIAGAAATVAIVAPQPEDPRRVNLLQYDLGQATMAIAIAAADLGLGTGHAAAEDQDLARDEVAKRKVTRTLRSGRGLLRRGLRILDNLDPERIELDLVRVVDAPGVTHMTYRVVK